MNSTEPATRFGRELHRWRSLRRLSQLDLANRAGTTQRHLSFVERGKSLPGRTMVLRLAESLELTLRERNGLLLTAGYAPVFSERSLDDPALRPARTALDSILEGHEPYPALIVRPLGEIVAANPAQAIFTEGVASHLLEPPVNAFRLALHPQGMAPRVKNFADWAQHVLEHLRTEAHRHPNPELDQLVAELEGYVPEARPGPDYLGFAVPLHFDCDDGELQLITTLSSFATAIDVTLSELRLEAFLPVDEATGDILRARASVTGGSRR